MYNCRRSARQSCGNILKSDFSVFRKSTCVPYLSPTSPAKAKSVTAPRGNISDRCWHNVMGISPRCGSHKAAPIAMSVAGRKYHYPSAYIMADRLPHRFSELLLFARSVNSFLGSLIQLKGVRLSVVLVLYEFRVLSWRSAPVALTLRLCRGKYLKYCYSIFKELRGRIFTPSLN